MNREGLIELIGLKLFVLYILDILINASVLIFLAVISETFRFMLGSTFLVFVVFTVMIWVYIRRMDCGGYDNGLRSTICKSGAYRNDRGRSGKIFWD